MQVHWSGGVGSEGKRILSRLHAKLMQVLTPVSIPGF